MQPLCLCTPKLDNLTTESDEEKENRMRVIFFQSYYIYGLHYKGTNTTRKQIPMAISIEQACIKGLKTALSEPRKDPT